MVLELLSDCDSLSSMSLASESKAASMLREESTAGRSLLVAELLPLLLLLLLLLLCLASCVCKKLSRSSWRASTLARMSTSLSLCSKRRCFSAESALNGCLMIVLVTDVAEDPEPAPVLDWMPAREATSLLPVTLEAEV